MHSGKVSYNNAYNYYNCIVPKILKKATALMMMIVALQAMAAVQTSLLMTSGDVETNPGPGRFEGEF